MKVSIFIRTYHKDIKWLNWCLRSIHKNLTGWDEIVICIPKGQQSLLSHLTAERVVTCPIYRDDYLGQQASKIQAHNWCKGDYIFYVDSDVVFFEGANIMDYFSDNKPVILYDKYENVGDAICWKPIVEKLYNETVLHEFMRRPGQLFKATTLQNFNQKFHDIEKYIMTQPHNHFSEFNVLGYFAWKYEQNDYTFIDLSKTEAPIMKCKQYWSWSGMTKQEKEELEKTI